MFVMVTFDTAVCPEVIGDFRGETSGIPVFISRPIPYPDILMMVSE